LGIGIGTQNMFGSNSYDHQDLVSIFYNHDAVYEYGVHRKLGTLNIVNGDVMEMIVNRSANIITWLTNENKIG